MKSELQKWNILVTALENNDSIPTEHVSLICYLSEGEKKKNCKVCKFVRQLIAISIISSMRICIQRRFFVYFLFKLPKTEVQNFQILVLTQISVSPDVL